MVRHWYPLAPSDDAFLGSAPFRYVHSVETTASSERGLRAGPAACGSG